MVDIVLVNLCESISSPFVPFTYSFSFLCIQTMGNQLTAGKKLIEGGQVPKFINKLFFATALRSVKRTRD